MKINGRKQRLVRVIAFIAAFILAGNNVVYASGGESTVSSAPSQSVAASSQDTVTKNGDVRSLTIEGSQDENHLAAHGGRWCTSGPRRH